jgi:DNA-directed RNA polymerase subunit RPC12/RpoP
MARSRNHRNHRRRRRKPSFWKEYRFEIVVVFLFTTGVFLLVEKMEIKATIYRFLRVVILGTANVLSDTAQYLYDLFMEVETSDIVGIILIMTATFMVYLRLRKRVIARHAELYVCPNCGRDLHRVHRHLSHRILGWLLWADVKYFSCRDCSYKGIRMSQRT